MLGLLKKNVIFLATVKEMNLHLTPNFSEQGTEEVSVNKWVKQSSLRYLFEIVIRYFSNYLKIISLRNTLLVMHYPQHWRSFKYLNRLFKKKKSFHCHCG